MLIVSDTGPLRYLIEIEAVEVLPRLYGRIWTTPDVMNELALPTFPERVRQWAAQVPQWLVIQQPAQIQFGDQLDAGEASAISLAVEQKADAVLMDERNGRFVARSKGLVTLGTLAVLAEAGLAGMLDFHQAVARLQNETRFRYTKALIQQVIADYEAARQSPGQGTESPGQA